MAASGSPVARHAGLAFLATMLLSGTAHGQSVWSNTGAADWNTGENWTPAAVPTAADIVVIDNGGEAQITTAGASAATLILGSTDGTTSGRLTITAGGTLTTSTDAAIIGDYGTGAVTVTRLGSDWKTGGDVLVGDQTGGTGTLTVDMSATMGVGGDMILGNSTGARGTLSVDGAGTVVTVDKDVTVGSAGTGFLTVSGGGEVDTTNLTAAALAGSNGTILVTGTDSLLDVQGALTVGGAGTGSLRIEAAGSVASLGAMIGTVAGATGTVTLNGAGSNWSNTGLLTIGLAGTGNLILEAGADVTTDTAAAGALQGGSGTIRVTGAGSTLTANGALTLGGDGTGSLTVEAGGAVISASAVLGDQSGGIGTVVVTGDGSSWTNDGLLVVGNAGSATLTVEAAGSAITGSATLGALADSSGAIHVTGEGSSLEVTDALVVGAAGTGLLDINSAGTVTTGALTAGLSAGGSGAITLSGSGSSLAVTDALIVGAAGDASLSIGLGANATAGSATIGSASGGTGTIALTDDGSTLDVADTLTVGDAGAGALTIGNGAAVSATDVILGADASGTGTAVVSNAGSTLTVGGSLAIGLAGTGALTIDAGGTVTAAGALVGALAGSEGTVLVNAAGSDLSVSGVLIIGGAGTGLLQVTAGGTLESADAVIGNGATGIGSVTVDGLGSVWTVAGDVTVGEAGAGALTISGQGAVTVDGGDGFVTLASASGSTGTLTIGLGAGTLDAAEVTGGDGIATVVFSHDETGYTFAPDITGSISLVQSGNGRTILTGANTYVGTTDVTAGTLAAGAEGAFSAASDFTVASGAVLDLSGFSQTVASLANAGTVSLAGTTAGTVLTVSGNYAGGGSIVLGTALGGDTSPTDRLVVQGDVSGQSRLAIVNLGGQGAQTSGGGIEIVTIAGASPSDAFSLGRTIAGAYDYRLYQGGVGTDAGNGNWYLRSDLSIAAQTYRAYPATLLAYSAASIGTLEQRTGGWTVGAATTTVPGGAFVRGAGLSSSTSPDTGSPYRQDLAFGQTGVAAELPVAAPGLVTAGVTATFGRSQVNVDAASHGAAGSGRIDTDAYGFGGTLTYWGQDGLYADAVGQLTYFDTGISTSDAGALVGGNSAVGTALSLEVGQRFQPTPSIAIVPQAQLLYASLGFDDLTDADGVAVGLSGESLLGRAGVRVEHSGFVDAIALDAMRYNAYVIANLYYAFIGDTDVSVGGTSLAQQTGRLTGEIGLGGALRVAARTSLYGEASYASAFGSGDAWSGSFGLRVQW